MDASNEFKFIMAKKKKSRKKSSQAVHDSSKNTDEDLNHPRTVPVQLINTNKNIKLRFVWDKAFKLFHSHRRVYKAVSGLNYRDYGTGVGPSYKEKRDIPRRSNSHNMGVKSQSFSHLSVDDNDDMDLNTYKNVDVGGAMSMSRSLHKKHEPGTSGSSGRNAGNSSISSNSSSSTTTNTTTGNSNGKERGEKPEYDIRNQMGNNTCTNTKTKAKLVNNNHNNCTTTTAQQLHDHENHHDEKKAKQSQTSVQVRRNQSTRSEQSYISSCNSSSRSSPSPGKSFKNCNCLVRNRQKRDGYSAPPILFPEHVYCECDCATNTSSRNVSPEFQDSGLDTWRKSQKNNNTDIVRPSELQMKKDLGFFRFQRKQNIIHGGGQNDRRKMDKGIKNQLGGKTILKTSISANANANVNDSHKNGEIENLNGFSVIDHDTEQGDIDINGHVELIENDYFDCLSEIDLNSDPGSYESNTNCSSTSSTIQNIENPHEMNLKLNFRHSSGTGSTTNASRLTKVPKVTQITDLHNEFDSLDLTLFEKRAEEVAELKKKQGLLKKIRDLGAFQEVDVESDCFYDTLENNNYDTIGIPTTTSARKEVSGGQIYDFIQDKSTNPHASLKKMGDKENQYYNWTDAGSEFEFMPTKNGNNREITLGHSPRGQYQQELDWEPYYCVLNQLDQTLTCYRSEEMSIFPGTPTRPRTQTVFGDNGISPTEQPRVRLDGGSVVKCLINNSKWGMNPVLEEEDEENSTEKPSQTVGGMADYSSGCGSNQRNSSSPSSTIFDTSYDKACGSIRRNSAPLTPLGLGQSQSTARETQSRFANFFSKRSFKSNPLKRTKSVTKLERKKASGPEPESNSLLYQSSRLRTSRSHESLLTWTNHSNFVNGMMSTLDLTAGDVAIRALHPSILGEDYAFQVITGNGAAKYYTCSSAAERNSWVHALQQSIKPYADEVRRCENSLKIWILEAKNVLGGKSRKRFFCELYLDEVLYSRTCGKSKTDMVFWGELFEFLQLPNCQMITVVLFREGDKKRKKERNTCLGKVKIPVSAVNSRSLIEKWYPVEPNSINNKDSPKDWPSIRIKCKFQSVDILPLRCYSPFLQYVKDEYGLFCESLESVLSVKAKEELASALVHVLHHENLAKDFISEISLQEILKSGDEKLTFRGNSIATKAMEAFLKLTGSEYLHSTLGAFIETFQVSEIDLEIDPMKLTQSANLAKNQQNLRMTVEHVWKCILHSATIFPLELRECFSHCREALKSAGKEDLSDHLISASIFLRFLCPAILSPSLFSITNEYPSEKSARNLTLIAKVLQTLANFTRFQGKENYMEFINDFLEREARNMKEFLSTISSPLSEDTMRKIRKEKEKQVPSGGFIDLAKYLSILSTVLSECVGKILKSNDRFKSLHDLLETIHNSLKMPANHFTSALPFPHLNSPAGSQSTTPSTPNPPSNFANLKLNRISLSGAGVQGQQTPLINHQNQQNNGPYQTPTAIYAVSNANPNVKNISTKPLQLQIPNSNGNSSGGSSSSSAGGGGGQNNKNNNRSGSQSQASSGYQSQSPILENEDKKEAINGVNMQAMINHANILNNNLQNKLIQERVNNNNHHNNIIKVSATPQTQVTSVFYRKIGSQSVDDLTSVGTTDLNREQNRKKRLTRSSSSSDEYEPGTYSLNKNRALLKHKAFNGQQNANDPKQLVDSKSQRKGNKNIQIALHHRLSRRSSAELLRRSHPYSSSEEESDSAFGHSNSHSREEAVPQLPPRRSHAKRNSSRPIPDEEKTLEEYEREMDELRAGMEELQAKLNRAEERLFGGQEVQSPQIQIFHQHPVQQHSPKIHIMSHYANQPKSSPSPPIPIHNNELLSALDKKQKLIDQQEQKIARLDSVNNQLLEALSQIRDSLQQQHLQAQQQKVQLQVQKQQQHLQALSAEIITPNYPNYPNGQYRQCQPPQMSPNSYLYHQSHNNGNNININGGAGDLFSQQQHQQQQVLYSNGHLNNQIPYVQRQMYHNNNNQPPPPPQYPQGINTTKVLITSEAYSNNNNNNNNGNGNGNVNISRSPSQDSLEEDSSSILGEQALKMLSELKSSSC